MPLKIFLSKEKGFCFGVERAVKIVTKIKDRANTFGQIIHNPQLVQKLEKQGKKVVNNLNEVTEKILIIRAHGASDKFIQKAKKRCLKIIDLTCPYVKKAQVLSANLEKNGYRVIIIGKRNHPEIVSIAENLNSPIIVENLPQTKKLGFYNKAGIISQTTFNIQEVDKITAEIKKHAEELKIYKTICDATQKRQKAAYELAKKVDTMIIVGGKNSSNTKRLFEICTKIVTSHHIETKNELKENWFKNKKKVGVTSGASTPKIILNEVVKTLRKMR